jgi:hypothetical protein
MLKPPYKPIDDEELDSYFKKAAEVCIQYDRASASLLQRRLDIGYARAARIIDQLEKAGILGPADGSKPREVLIRSIDDLPDAIKKAEDESRQAEQPPKMGLKWEISERAGIRTQNQWLKRTESGLRFSHPMAYHFLPVLWTANKSSTLDVCF